MTKKYYFILYPEDSDAQDCDICHLILASQTADGWSFPDAQNSCCGKRKTAASFDPAINDKMLDDPNAIRLYLAKQQNAGINFCAQCVATFYAQKDL